MAAIKRANRQFLSFNVKMLKLLGLWGSDGEVDDGKNKWTDLRNYYALPLFLPSVVPIVYDLVLLTTEKDSMVKLIIVVMELAVLMGTFYMSACFVKKRKKMKKLLRDLEAFKRYSSVDMIEINNKINKFSVAYFATSTLGCLVYVSLPLVTKRACEEHKTKDMVEYGIPCGLVERYRFPFKFDYAPLYQICLVQQILLSFFVTYTVSNITMLSCGVLYHTVRQFKELRKLIVSSAVHETKRLGRLIKFHKAILRYCQQLNEVFGMEMLLHVTLTSLILSTLGFIIIFSKNAVDSFRYAVHLSAWLSLLFVLCIYGQQLIDESVGVGVDVYSTPWYLCSVRTQKDVAMVMVRAQKPLTLSALNYSVMSLPTFLKILSSAYSYFTLFLNVRKN